MTLKKNLIEWQKSDAALGENFFAFLLSKLFCAVDITEFILNGFFVKKMRFFVADGGKKPFEADKMDGRSGRKRLKKSGLFSFISDCAFYFPPVNCESNRGCWAHYQQLPDVVFVQRYTVHGSPYIPYMGLCSCSYKPTYTHTA